MLFSDVDAIDDGIIETNLEQEADELTRSLCRFTQRFYYLRTRRKFMISEPVGRESHHITIFKALTEVMRGNITHLRIHVPPRYGKTEMVINFIAWALAQYPDSNFMYVSFSHSLAKLQTRTVKEIIQLPEYRDLFGVNISEDASSQADFKTNFGGEVYAAGSDGTLTGRGGGIKYANRFGGAIIIDDIHKPEEVTSDTMRKSVIGWFSRTLLSRVNDPKTPIIFIGQRLHQDDLPAHLHEFFDWHEIIIPAIDDAGNALSPNDHSIEQLNKKRETEPYVFAAQYQQNPIPAGGALFKPEWFYLTDKEPTFYATFTTVDTAETEKTYNDATVFTFCGLYYIEHAGRPTDMIGLEIIDCVEIRVEPHQLVDEFMAFHAGCMRHDVPPSIIAIEKRSMGSLLVAELKRMRGMRVLPIERTVASGNKTARFIEIQPYIARGQVSLPKYGRHTNLVLRHMEQITANNAHAHDDIADTLYDGIKLGIIDKVVTACNGRNSVSSGRAIKHINKHLDKIIDIRSKRYGR